MTKPSISALRPAAFSHLWVLSITIIIITIIIIINNMQYAKIPFEHIQYQ